MLWMLPSALAMPEPIEDLGFILEAPTKGWFAQGIGAPTVAWSGTEYVMFFESRVDPPTSACDQAWVIGRATSKDGIDWTIDEEPVYLPSWSDTTSPEACAVAQPAVVYDGVDWHLFYSMWSVSTRPGHGWVTGEGIGHAVSSDGQTFRSVEAPTPIGAWGTSSWESPASSELFYTPTTPTALLVDDEIWIAATNGWRGPLLARYAIHTGEWLVTYRTPYVESGWSPALDCRPGGGVYYAEVRGDDGDRSVRRVESDDFTHWDHSDSIEASPYEDVRHLEGMWAGGVRLVYYSAIASDGRPAIGLMTTGSEWSDPQGRNCNLSTGVETDTDTDTDSDTDTDADTDTDTDTDADTDADTDTDVSTDTLIDTADGERSGCGCGTPGTPAWTGLVLALLARRRTYA